MNQKLLDLHPKRYLCPYCGCWHDWNLSKPLRYYDIISAGLACEKQNSNGYYDLGCYKTRKTRIRFSNGYCHYETMPTCDKANLDIDGQISIEDISEIPDRALVKFTVPFIPDRELGSDMCCSDCPNTDICVMCKLSDAKLLPDSYSMDISFGFEFEQSDYEKIYKADSLELKEKELQECKQALNCEEQSLNGNVSKKQVSQRTQVKKNKEENTMANNIFNMNMEFGQNKDENIASTIMGVAVKNGDNWRIYDKKKHEITDVGNMQLGNLPIFVMPTTNLAEGDLIKDSGEYYFVIKTNNVSTQTLCAKTGELKTVIPIKNVFGFSCYTKVIALSDSISMEDDLNVENLAIMSMMCGQNGQDNNQTNQLLPLLLFKDKLGNNDDDMMKMMLMSSTASTSTGDGTAMSQMLPLMLLTDKSDSDDDMMKMMLMSSMMNGNIADNNPAMSYLMLNMFMENRKNTTKVQSPTKGPSQITSKKTTARRKKNESAQSPAKGPSQITSKKTTARKKKNESAQSPAENTSQLTSEKTTADSTEDPAE